jgi:hypothetical protein
MWNMPENHPEWKATLTTILWLVSIPLELCPHHGHNTLDASPQLHMPGKGKPTKVKSIDFLTISPGWYWQYMLKNNQTWRKPAFFNPLSCIEPYFIILLCLMPDDFIRQGESAGTQRVNS